MWFGMLTDLTMKSQSGSQPVVFVGFLVYFQVLKEIHSSLCSMICSTVHIPPNWDSPHALKGVGFPIQAGELWGGESVIHSGAGHKTPEVPLQYLEGCFLPLTCLEITKGWQHAQGNQLLLQVGLVRNFANLAALLFSSFISLLLLGKALSLELQLIPALDKKNLNHKLWFLCAFSISSAFIGSMGKCMYGPNPERYWGVNALWGCVQCTGLSFCCQLT